MANYSSSNDPISRISFNEDIAANIIHLQGEELIRLRNELENAQKLNTTAFDFLRSTDEYMLEIQNTFDQRRMRLSFLEGTLVDLQRENATSSDTLRDMRADLHNLCGILGSEQSSSHPVTQDNIVDEGYKLSSVSGSTRDESVMMDDLSTEVSITNVSTTDSDVELSKPIAQTYSSMKPSLDEPLKENNLENAKRWSDTTSDEAARLTPQLAQLKEVALTALSKKDDKKGQKDCVQDLNTVLLVCNTADQAPVILNEIMLSTGEVVRQEDTIQIQLGPALHTIAQLSKEALFAENQCSTFLLINLSNHLLRPNSISLEPVAPLQQSENRWVRKVISNVDPDSPEYLHCKVLALLNKLTMENFDSISDQIIAWANKSENEKDGRSLILVIRLVFGKATDEATWSEMYARLCRKMMEQISPKVRDDGMKNLNGKPTTGGHLFRKYLLNRCQEDFERGWINKEATLAAAATNASEEKITLYSEEFYAAQRAKRRSLGVTKFIGELFKMQMLTERIMHECVKLLLANAESPKDDVESLLTLLTTVGQMLDTHKARAHMDVYFSRVKELLKNQNVSSRMKFMLQDLIELRERKWQTRHRRDTVPAPTTIAKIHETAAKEEAAREQDIWWISS